MNYLRQEYPWNHRGIASEVDLRNATVELPAELRAALIVHVGSDLAGWELIRPYVQNVALALGSQVEILISVVQTPDVEQLQQAIATSLEHKNSSVVILENRGMDVGPFLWMLNALRLRPLGQQPHIILKLHTKTSHAWRAHLCEPLFATPLRVGQLVTLLLRSPSVGMLGSRYNMYNTLQHSGPNRPLIDEYLRCFGYAPLSQQPAHQQGRLRFVGGTVFIAKMEAFTHNLNAVDLFSWQLELPLGRSNDRTEAQRTHALERILGIIVQCQGYQLLAV
jgi:lipopolysaccharide biosynthesis protein